jgi:hypothetical protein
MAKKLNLKTLASRMSKQIATDIVLASEEALERAYDDADAQVRVAHRARDGAREAAKVARGEAALYKRALIRIRQDDLVEGETPKTIAEAVLPDD